MPRVVLAAVLLSAMPSLGQEPKQFVGNWTATSKAIGFDHSLVIAYDKDKWSLASNYSKDNAVAGTAQGLNFEFKDGTLSYSQKYVKKPINTWKDSDNLVTLSFKGEQLEMVASATGKLIRTYNRVEAKDPPKQVAKEEPKPAPIPSKSEPPQPEPVRGAPVADDKGFAGLWKGHCPGTPDSTIYLKVMKDGDKYTAEGHVLSKAKQYVGHFPPTEGKLEAGKAPNVTFEASWDAGLVGSKFEPTYKLTHFKKVLNVVCSKNRAPLAAASDSEFTGLKPPDKIAAKPAAKSPPDAGTTSGLKTVKTTKIVLLPNTPATDAVKTFDLPAKSFHSSMSKDGKRLAVTSFDATKVNSLALYDTDTGTPLWTAGTAKDAFTRFASVAVSSDGNWVACDPAGPGGVVLLDGATGKVLPNLAGSKTFAKKLAFHPTKPLLAFGTEVISGNVVHVGVLDAATGRPLWRNEKSFNHRLLDLVFSPAGDAIAVAGKTFAKGDEFQVRLFDAAAGAVLHDFPTDKREPTAIAFSPDGKTLAVYHSTFGKPAAIQVYDLHTKEKVSEIGGIPDGSSAAHNMTFSPDGKMLAVGTWKDGHLRLIDVASGKSKSAITRAFDLTSGLGDVHWLPDGERLIVLSAKQVKVFRVADAKTVE